MCFVLQALKSSLAATRSEVRAAFQQLQESAENVKEDVVVAASRSGERCNTDVVTTGCLDYDFSVLGDAAVSLADQIVTLSRFRAVVESLCLNAKEYSRSVCDEGAAVHTPTKRGSVVAPEDCSPVQGLGLYERDGDVPVCRRMSVIHAPALLLLCTVRPRLPLL